MGVDIPNVRIVINLGVPNSDWILKQQTGRAGRDGQQAVAVNLTRKVRVTHSAEPTGIHYFSI